MLGISRFVISGSASSTCLTRKQQTVRPLVFGMPRAHSRQLSAAHRNTLRPSCFQDTVTRNASTGGRWVSCSTKWSVALPQDASHRLTSLQLTGLPPFYDENTNEMYRKILQDPLRFPDDMGSEARSILTLLLNRDPSRRLGVNGAQDIKNHPFFARHIDWKKLMAKKIQPPFKPAVVSRPQYSWIRALLMSLVGERH
jgi:serine/threonine protein kinase